ncbi:Transcriptional coactivator [Phaffia rhodozyma]|uniref:Transcriptional coactivator n=1 Tax=Phaffia rhodozyma TaxID=264483 RepID=A0A0F7SX85_PHARH|nr:Transcriptional coactivator [Phaffia rhodozyma]
MVKRAKQEPMDSFVVGDDVEDTDDEHLGVANPDSEEEGLKSKSKKSPKTKSVKKEAAPPKKKPRTSAPSAASLSGTWKTNGEGEKYVELSATRRLSVREFKGKPLIDLREYYTDKTTGEAKPGSKGISLSPDQWAILKGSMNAVDALLA